MVKVSVATAARLMNKGPQFVRVALQRSLVPFGFAVKISENKNSKYDYYINPKQFCDYLGITEQELENNVIKKEPDPILPEPLF
jgi:hypothetical protein